MRLTDADELMPLFIEKAHKMPDKHGVKLGEDWLLDYNDIKDVIDNVPPVEVDKLILIWARRSGKRAMMINALILHGKWEKQNYFYKCSVCGVYSPDGTDLHNYCPRCGAKMDVEADNE